MEGGRVQQSAMVGVISAFSSISLKSLGRSRTQTLSSLSTANPVTPPIFHLLGRGLGQSGSNLNFGAAGSWAARDAHKNNNPRPAETCSPEFPNPTARLFSIMVILHPRCLERAIVV